MFPLAKTIASIKKAKLIGIMLACAVLALVVILCAAGLVTWVTSALVNLKWGWLDGLVAGAAGIAAGAGGWFMLPALTALIAGMFQERVIHKVEKACYPNDMRQEEPKFWPDILHDIKFTLWALFLNIIILPFYLIGIGFILSIALNTHLLGREFFESAAGYHLGCIPAAWLLPC
jgi:CysZ protein